jgi:hypothetical protein
MIRFLVVVTLALVSTMARSQEKVTLNGYIKDADNGEELIGVTVYIPQLKAGTATNAYGFYSITVPKGTYEVQYTFVGYSSQNVTVTLDSDVSRNIELGGEAQIMNEVEISERPLDENVIAVQMSKNTLNISQVKKLPTLFGEVDIIKNVQALPGVISAGEGTSSFFVRGGGGDQNLILIDEAPIYDASHLGGMVSVFNADVIKESELYKGGIPSRFGGRLSSILEVRTIDGNNKRFGVTAGIGSMASRVMIEAPIVKDKSSFILSGRTSNLGLYLKAANTDNSINFYDLNAKVNWRANNKNRFFVSGYTGRDKLSFSDGEVGFGWGNSTGTFRWNHLFNEKLFSNTTVILSSFDYLFEIKDPIQGFKWSSNLQELSVKNDLTYFHTVNNEFTFGYHITGRRFSPATIEPNSEESMFEKTVFDKMYALDHGIYLSNQRRITDALTMDVGLRVSIFQSMGPGKVYIYNDPKDNSDPTRVDSLEYGSWKSIKNFVNFEPRFGLRYSLSDDKSIKLSYNRMVQNTHLVAAGTVPLPFNTWSPSGYYLKPQIADQIALGYFQNLKDNMYEASAEIYYKDVQHVTDFADNAEIQLNKDLVTEYRQGDAWAYGAEFMVTKKEGRLTGMASYTWSKALRQIEGVNQGREYVANYDRRNVVNMNAAFELNDKWTFGGAFTYSTGRPTTVPSGKYEYGEYNPDQVSERNGYRLPAFHRLDLSATLNPRKNATRKWKGQWIFSLYNVYSRKNAFTVYTRTKKDSDGDIIGDGTQKEARMVYLFPFMPSVTYNIKF